MQLRRAKKKKKRTLKFDVYVQLETINMKKLPKNVLSLNQFMLRREVINLYRDIFRAIKKVPDESSRYELKEWARSDFRKNTNQTDEIVIKMLIQQGRRSLNELKTSLNLSGITKT